MEVVERSADTDSLGDDDVNAVNSASPLPEQEAEPNADSDIFCRICQVRLYCTFAMSPFPQCEKQMQYIRYISA